MSEEPEVQYEVCDPETGELLEAMLKNGTSVMFEAGAKSFDDLLPDQDNDHDGA